jgi:hypothetical protein
VSQLAFLQPARNMEDLIPSSYRTCEKWFQSASTLGEHIANDENKIMSDLGLKNNYAANGGEMCSTVELRKSLKILTEEGPRLSTMKPLVRS